MVHSSCLNPKDLIVMGQLLAIYSENDWLTAVVNGTHQISGDGDDPFPENRTKGVSRQKYQN